MTVVTQQSHPRDEQVRYKLFVVRELVRWILVGNFLNEVGFIQHTTQNHTFTEWASPVVVKNRDRHLVISLKHPTESDWGRTMVVLIQWPDKKKIIVVVAALCVLGLLIYMVLRFMGNTSTVATSSSSSSSSAVKDTPAYPSGTKLGRTLTIERRGPATSPAASVGHEYVHVFHLGAKYQGQMQRPTGGSPGYDRMSDPNNTNMVDSGIAGPTASLFVDFGRDVPVDEVVIGNRRDGDANHSALVKGRLTNTRVVLRDSNKKDIWSQNIDVSQDTYSWKI
jgi:hypothetical protein